MLDTDDPLWPFTLGQQFLAAAQSCGFECARTFVSDRIVPEAMPPGCPCQLAVVVAPGWVAQSSAPPVNCVPRKMADVFLYLDLCRVEVDDKSVPGPVELNPSAARNLTVLWQVMGGLQRARFHGNLGDSDCGAVTPGRWEPVSDEGAMVRWRTQWRVLLS